jgi:NAD(P)-dependent dehydrogenase (short-subunit alcohol dehydrogenase family)
VTLLQGRSAIVTGAGRGLDRIPLREVAAAMEEKITVRNTESGQTLEVVVLSKRADAIEVVLGSGVHSVRCMLTPTRNALAYAGKAMGRELVYERSRAQVAADIERLNPNVRGPRRR